VNSEGIDWPCVAGERELEEEHKERAERKSERERETERERERLGGEGSQELRHP